MKNNNKNMHLFAIAALAATLMVGQVSISSVYAGSTSVQLSSLIPDNVTVEQPMPLSDISLPDSEYGTLSWVDSSSVPSEKVQSYDVVFKPYDSSVLSKISGWDGESDEIYGSVTVVVSGMESNSEESDEWNEDSSDDYDENQDNYDEDQDSSGANEEQKDDSAEDDQEVTPEATAAPSKEENSEEETEITEKPSEKTEDESETVKTDTKEEQDSEDNKAEDTTEEDAKVTPSETPEVTETPEATETPETPETTETPKATVTPEADKDNIFDAADKDIKEDNRSTDFVEDLTDAQKAELAEENHSANGITVSGIDLPYYVQFRVTSGDDYEFTNASEANVFQSYEFELWDLKNDTEYEVPDGEYVSVTVPVKAGYSYTIEHLLDSGAMETIVPSVDGSTMIFSTHSFSPFGIAGSKTLVGEEIEEDGYDTGVVTETPDSVQAADLTPAGDNTADTADSSNAASDSTADTSEVTSAPADSTDQTAADTSSSTDQNSEEDGSSSVKAVHTGDNTIIWPFVILAVLAGVVALALIIFLIIVAIEKKNKNK